MPGELEDCNGATSSGSVIYRAEPVGSVINISSRTTRFIYPSRTIVSDIIRQVHHTDICKIIIMFLFSLRTFFLLFVFVLRVSGRIRSLNTTNGTLSRGNNVPFVVFSDANELRGDDLARLGGNPVCQSRASVAPERRPWPTAWSSSSSTKEGSKKHRDERTEAGQQPHSSRSSKQIVCPYDLPARFLLRSRLLCSRCYAEATWAEKPQHSEEARIAEGPRRTGPSDDADSIAPCVAMLSASSEGPRLTASQRQQHGEHLLEGERSLRSEKVGPHSSLTGNFQRRERSSQQGAVRWQGFGQPVLASAVDLLSLDQNDKSALRDLDRFGPVEVGRQDPSQRPHRTAFTSLADGSEYGESPVRTRSPVEPSGNPFAVLFSINEQDSVSDVLVSTAPPSEDRSSLSRDTLQLVPPTSSLLVGRSRSATSTPSPVPYPGAFTRRKGYRYRRKASSAAPSSLSEHNEVIVPGNSPEEVNQLSVTKNGVVASSEETRLEYRGGGQRTAPPKHHKPVRAAAPPKHDNKPVINSAPGEPAATVVSWTFRPDRNAGISRVQSDVFRVPVVRPTNSCRGSLAERTPDIWEQWGENLAASFWGLLGGADSSRTGEEGGCGDDGDEILPPQRRSRPWNVVAEERSLCPRTLQRVVTVGRIAENDLAAQELRDKSAVEAGELSVVSNVTLGELSSREVDSSCMVPLSSPVANDFVSLRLIFEGSAAGVGALSGDERTTTLSPWIFSLQLEESAGAFSFAFSAEVYLWGELDLAGRLKMRAEDAADRLGKDKGKARTMREGGGRHGANRERALAPEQDGSSQEESSEQMQEERATKTVEAVAFGGGFLSPGAGVAFAAPASGERKPSLGVSRLAWHEATMRGRVLEKPAGYVRARGGDAYFQPAQWSSGRGRNDWSSQFSLCPRTRRTQSAVMGNDGRLQKWLRSVEEANDCNQQRQRLSLSRQGGRAGGERAKSLGELERSPPPRRTKADQAEEEEQARVCPCQSASPTAGEDEDRNSLHSPVAPTDVDRFPKLEPRLAAKLLTRDRRATLRFSAEQDEQRKHVVILGRSSTGAERTNEGAGIWEEVPLGAPRGRDVVPVTHMTIRVVLKPNGLTRPVG